MLRKVNLFKFLDEKFTNLFQKLSQTKLSKVAEIIENNPNETTKKIIYFIISFSIVTLPLAIVLTIYISNLNKKEMTDKTYKIISDIKKIETEESAINKTIKSLIPAREMNSEKSFSNYIYKKIRSSDVGLNNIKINQINALRTVGDVNVVEVKGVVQGLGSKEVTKIFEIINKTLPLRYNSIKISKDRKSQLLSVQFDYEARVKK